jgi:hypothetical protein
VKSKTPALLAWGLTPGCGLGCYLLQQLSFHTPQLLWHCLWEQLHLRISLPLILLAILILNPSGAALENDILDGSPNSVPKKETNHFVKTFLMDRDQTLQACFCS